MAKDKNCPADNHVVIELHGEASSPSRRAGDQENRPRFANEFAPVVTEWVDANFRLMKSIKD
jgi:hypothetical protein